MENQNIKSKAKLLREKCQSYLRNCLKFWATQGHDPTSGGYFEAMDLQGNPLKELDRRFRVQTRNIFSHAAGTAAGYGDFVEVAEQAFDYTCTHYFQGGRGFAFSSDSRGEIVDSQLHAYDHAFALLAFRWLYSVTGKKKHRQGVEQVWSIFQKQFHHSSENFKGGIKTSIPQPDSNKEPIIQQNPHMHLFEALMDNHVLTSNKGDKIWLEEATHIYNLYKNYFYNSSDRVIREFFNDDYTPYLNKEWVDPGHHYEWIWLLYKYQKLSGEPSVSIPEIYDFAETNGKGIWGLAYEFCSPDGNVIHSSHRMWPQTEKIKAQLALYENTGQLSYLELAMESVETLFSVFCNLEIPGVWYDKFDNEGNRLSSQSPASTLYHLYISLDEFIRVSKLV